MTGEGKMPPLGGVGLGLVFIVLVLLALRATEAQARPGPLQLEEINGGVLVTTSPFFTLKDTAITCDDSNAAPYKDHNGETQYACLVIYNTWSHYLDNVWIVSSGKARSVAVILDGTGVPPLNWKGHCTEGTWATPANNCGPMWRESLSEWDNVNLLGNGGVYMANLAREAAEQWKEKTGQSHGNFCNHLRWRSGHSEATNITWREMKSYLGHIDDDAPFEDAWPYPQIELYGCAMELSDVHVDAYPHHGVILHEPTNGTRTNLTMHSIASYIEPIANPSRVRDANGSWGPHLEWVIGGSAVDCPKWYEPDKFNAGAVRGTMPRYNFNLSERDNLFEGCGENAEH